MTIDPNVLMNVFMACATIGIPLSVYLVKMGKDIAIVKNDIQWIKLKAYERRKEDYTRNAPE